VSLTDLFSNKTLCVALAPERITLAVRAGKRLLPDTAVTLPIDHPEGHWQGALAALRTWLEHEAQQVAGLPLAISISNRWCQLAMLPWSDALLEDDSARRFALAQLAAVYGDAAHGWSIVCDDAPYGQMRLACAIERDFLDGLQALAKECGHRCVSVESALAVAVRAVAGSAPRALALQERGRIVLAQLDKGRIVGVQAQPCRSDWQADLAQAWQRWSLRAPELAGIDSVALLRSDETPASGTLSDLFNAVRLPSFTLAPAFAAVCMMGH
jgi:hypothetical protein